MKRCAGTQEGKSYLVKGAEIGRVVGYLVAMPTVLYLAAAPGPLQPPGRGLLWLVSSIMGVRSKRGGEKKDGKTLGKDVSSMKILGVR